MDIFISYKREDEEFARYLFQQLSSWNFAPWLDVLNIPLVISRESHGWDDAIHIAMKNASIVVGILTPESLGSKNVLDEWDFALRNEKSFYLLWVRDVEEADIPPRWGRVHRIDLRRDVERGLIQLRDILLIAAESQFFAESIRKRMAELHKQIEALTRDQKRVFQVLHKLKRARISGCAGSGKTLVAAQKAIDLARTGSVLFLCHNPLLAEHVHYLTAGSGVTVIDFCSWVLELTETRESERLSAWTHYEEPDERTLASALENLAATKHFDAVIVDEGQDFRDDWWVIVEMALAGEESSFFIFHDNNQSLLPNRGEYPIVHPEVDLSRNCRNSGRIYELVRYFDSSAPEAEASLRSRGEVKVIQYETGREIDYVRHTVASLYEQGYLEDAALILCTADNLEESALAGLQVQARVCEPWQNEVRRQFKRILSVYDRRGVELPPGGGEWVHAELSNLSGSVLPVAEDIELVRTIAGRFGVRPALRSRIMKLPQFRNAFHWSRVDKQLRLRRGGSAPIWAAELLIHFQRPDWNIGIPEAGIITITPFYLPKKTDVLPLYTVANFKGLEADTVILVLRGKMPKFKEALYVGVSRARFLLNILTDSVSSTALPKSFIWD